MEDGLSTVHGDPALSLVLLEPRRDLGHVPTLHLLMAEPIVWAVQLIHKLVMKGRVQVSLPC